MKPLWHERPLLCFVLSGWLLMVLLLEKDCAHKINATVTLAGLMVKFAFTMIVNYLQ